MIVLMKAMCLYKPGEPLAPCELAVPQPTGTQLLIRVRACAVCRTDLHIASGELPPPKLPLVLGHQIVGVVVDSGADAAGFPRGERVGVPWLGGTCGHCRYCESGRENLCDTPSFTGYTIDGGFSEYALADSRFCFRLPGCYEDGEAAPLLCAGLIGFRSLRMVEKAPRLGLYGFGGAAHIICQIAANAGRTVYAFTRPNDAAAQSFARSLGAEWAGGSGELPAEPLDAAIIFAPVGALVPQALRAVGKGGQVICGGIHMSDIPSFPYKLLWEERSIRSVANLTREDGRTFFKAVEVAKPRVRITRFPLSSANEALSKIREGEIEGAAVLYME